MDVLEAVLSGDEAKKKEAMKIGRIKKEIAKRGMESVSDWPAKMDDVSKEDVQRAREEMKKGQF